MQELAVRPEQEQEPKQTQTQAQTQAQTQEPEPQPDFTSETYKDAYSRINAIVIEGEREAHNNYLAMGELLPDHKAKLADLAKMEKRHEKGFTRCGKNLSVTADMDFAREYFSQLHGNFQNAYKEGKLVTCFLIQSLIIEAFAIAAYQIYIPVADPFARKITEGVVQDEFKHLNFGEQWLKENFEASKAELEEANKQNLPLIWKMLNQVTEDARVLGMEKEELIEEFMDKYGEALSNIGFSGPELMKMSAAGVS
ncbi:MAG: aldehyde oxygenase (deformylating) [Cyanobacteria bacterium SBLK]|nr:aldehyde oxygenase (deformylating) [Cyanobacteria bacterium SBLK]